MKIKDSKKQLILIITLLAFNATYANNTEDVPRFVLALGRLHPLILHLPIGGLLLTFFLDVLGRFRKDYTKKTIKYGLGFSSIFSILACIFGYFLSLEGGYSTDVLDIHFWTGIATAVLITTLFLLVDNKDKTIKKTFFPLFVLTIIGISVAGHYGSVLTHGDNYITEYIKPLPKAKTITHVDSLNMYDDVVLKIFDDKCIECHNTSKRKGELALHTTESILKGGESGDVVTQGNADKSILYKHLLLPISDEKHMPPEGKPQLTKDEIWLIEYWINKSNDLNTKAVAMPKSDTLNKLLKKYLVFNKKIIKEADLSDIQKVEAAGFLVRKFVPNQPELWVKFNKDSITKKAVKSLSNLKEQIIELDLSSSNLTDDMISGIKNLKNLEKLDISDTHISDKTLLDLKELKTLKILNLVKTDVGDKGLESLLAAIDLERAYVWETSITKDAAKQLQNNFKVNLNNGIADGFVEITRLKPPILVTKKTLFTDTLSIKLNSKLRGAKVYYTLDGTEPDSTALVYKSPILIDSTTSIAIKLYKKGWLPSETMKEVFIKVTHKVEDYTIVHKPEDQYKGPKKLFDFTLGTKNFKDEKWNGYLGNDLNTTINLGEPKEVSTITVNCLVSIRDWVLFPKSIQVYASSNRTSGFKQIGNLPIVADNKKESILIKKFSVKLPEKTKAQYFKVVVKNPKILPEWHEGAGNPSWIFVDEIILW
ncbi:chitobiase/beta-hexosaminidase C-terminal domain-containing protein [Sabulilitoribacter arenilitoris]|uniref:Chitobiase/beta-hexosaminidase C-terminal domain-containing protein n=1 Tax=Wocania arenilitoris TaxID=2044858 RepID=A0AAE3ELY9_9FLAO|nr:c-type cytochrome domain-containing protein [Wocania arenilitoris]MCF7567845.1 chitobiase/beta-hexosaminidase C-terminal domain-containing protein [Wocania arenilitoris]